MTPGVLYDVTPGVATRYPQLNQMLYSSQAGWSTAGRVVIAQYLPLEGLEKGKYHLTVLVEDRISGNKVTETADFEIVG